MQYSLAPTGFNESILLCTLPPSLPPQTLTGLLAPREVERLKVHQWHQASHVARHLPQHAHKERETRNTSQWGGCSAIAKMVIP
eukprot:6376895-Amphidinium_carterae.1